MKLITGNVHTAVLENPDALVLPDGWLSMDTKNRLFEPIVLWILKDVLCIGDNNICKEYAVP